MKKTLTASALAVLVLAASVPAFAGGDHCSGSASSASAEYSCAGHGAKSAAWAGAWLQRSGSGEVTVAEVAKGSPAAKAGLKSGDVVLAVNGYDLSNADSRAMCASKADCTVGSTVTYTVRHSGASKSKNVKLKLEKMPSDATERFASRQANFEPMLAAVVMPTAN
jgi:C-terminal processing protease CtpA/Prc